MMSPRRIIAVLAPALVVGAAAVWPAGAKPPAPPSPPPGPSVLYAPPPPAPQLEANQLTVAVPRTVSNPAGQWSATLAAGLYDPATGGWRPTGSSALGGATSRIFNLGFRFDEPVVGEDTPPDTAQAAALSAHEPTRFAHPIDFDALASGERRTSVPDSGVLIRIFPSRLQLGEGRNLSQFPAYLGQLQPYSLYVPEGYEPGTPAGLVLDLHSLSEHHWQYNGSEGQRQLGDTATSLVATALARGDDGWYQNEAEYDVFEMWNDVDRLYTLDPERVAVTGYSMGGFAGYRLGTLWPDLFGKAVTVVGPPGDGIWAPPLNTVPIETLTNLTLPNARNLPYMNIVAVLDELVPIHGTTAQNVGRPPLSHTSFEDLGYRYHFLVHPTADHLAIAVLGYDLPHRAEFIGDARRDPNPHHVTFKYIPQTDDAALALVHDHAYWVSALRLADPAVGTPIPTAMVDIFSHAFGRGDPESSPGAGGGTVPLPYTEVNRTWAEPPAAPAENKLTAVLTNVGSVRVDAVRAALNPRAPIVLDVTADGAGTFVLVGPFKGRVSVTDETGAVVFAGGVNGEVPVPVASGAHTYTVTAKR
jgi:pimeloyl-ACP methyl ester carboxylesterase